MMRLVLGAAGLLGSFLFLTGPAGAWSNEVFEDYLQAGRWSESADDNASGESLPLSLVEAIVRRYCEKPTDADALDGMGIFALTVGAANWGIAEADGLPSDPNKRRWRSTTGADAGKHLMSYAIGGVGISHGDVEDLYTFLLELAGRNALPEPQ